MSQHLNREQMTSCKRSVQLVFKCTGLECGPSASFQTGMLTGLLNRAKSTATSKTERRSILASISTSVEDFHDVYRSELIDDSPDITPSLVAEIKYAAIGETLIRVRVLYSSPMTGGKDVILCESIFPLHEIIRDKARRVSMASKYLKNHAILEMTVIEPFKPVLQNTSFAPIAKKNPGNPYKQSYMFYSDDISIPHAVYCEEYGLESRISVKMVIAFLDEALRTLKQSIDAWDHRMRVEKIRQGHFENLKDANSHGWHQVTITVLEVRIAENENLLLSGQMRGEDDSDSNNNNPDKSGHKNNLGPRSLRRAITTFSGGGVSGTKKKGSHDESKPSTFVEIAMTSM